MTQAQYKLWLAVWNKSIMEGLPSHEAFNLADKG